MTAVARKALLVGMDGVSVDFLLRMVAEGKLPNVARFLDEGTLAPYCFSSMPTSTPENWTTIATGAWNGAHQVMSFQTFQPEELKGRWMSGYTSRECQAEFIWDAAERAGKQSLLLKYPASWPPTMKSGAQVCGCHVRPCLHQLDGSYLFSTVERPDATMISFRPAEGWTGVPRSGAVPFEATIAFGRRTNADLKGGGLSVPVCKIPKDGKPYYLLAVGKTSRYDQLLICRSKDTSSLVASLAPGQWSDWIVDEFPTEEGIKQGSLRFRLEEFSSDLKSVRLFCTHIMDVDNYTFPRQWSRELFDNVGPYICDIGWDGLGHKGSRGWISEDTFYDLSDHQHQWLASAAEYLAQKVEWTLCFLQVHCIDCAHHYCLHAADPYANPNEAEQKSYLEFIERLHVSLDRMIGRFMDFADEETILILVSDHGGLAGIHGIDVNKALEVGGIDPSEAHVQNGVFVNVNLAGRDARGTVPESEYEKVRDRIIAALYEYVDPETRLHPFTLALKKEDARILGLYGDPTARKIGDVLFAVRGEFGGNHGKQLSTAKWGIGSNSSILAFRGPGIKKGHRLQRTAWLVDIVPTICYALDLPVPRDAHGSVLYQALDGDVRGRSWV